jgi:hypothetical protein
VALHLRAEPEVEAASRVLLQIPSNLRDDHRAARKRDRDVGAERKLARVLGGDGQRQKRIVPGLGRARAVETELLDLARRRGDVGDRCDDAAGAGVLGGVRIEQAGLDSERHRPLSFLKRALCGQPSITAWCAAM